MKESIMLVQFREIKTKNHKILGDLYIDLMNKSTGEVYKTIVFVGENGCGKTQLLNHIFESKGLHHLYIRQNMRFVGAVNELGKVIRGTQQYPSHYDDDLTSKRQAMLKEKANIRANNLQQALDILMKLGDETICNIVSNGDLDNIKYSSTLMTYLVGNAGPFDLDTLSSGQQELLLRLKSLRETQIATDCILLDEPEASLHPRWQTEIVDLVRALVTDQDGSVPQMFIATHSEKILQSIIGKEDVLIVRLFKKDGVIKAETIDEMGLRRLPSPTFAELDYVVFKIDTFEYCSQLYDYIEWKTDQNDRSIDKIIVTSDFYDETIHYKEWFNERYGKVTSHNIATYCRNYFHHPKDREKPTPKQLHDAIELLRNVILTLK